MAFFAPARMMLVPTGVCRRALSLSAPHASTTSPLFGFISPSLSARSLSTIPVLQRHSAVPQSPASRLPPAALVPLSRTVRHN